MITSFCQILTFRAVFIAFSLLFMLTLNNNSYGQDRKSLKLEKVTIIYFEEGQDNTVINFSEDSTHAFFRIANKEMETEEKRDHAIKRHKEKRLPFPNFYTDLYTISKPKNIKSLEGIGYITVEEYRNGGYYLPSIVTLICRTRNNELLKWKNAFHMAYE